MIKALLLSCLLFVSGCRTITYHNPQDGKKITYRVIGLNTSVDSLEIQTDKGVVVKITGSKTEASSAIDLANKVIDKVPSVK